MGVAGSSSCGVGSRGGGGSMGVGCWTAVGGIAVGWVGLACDCFDVFFAAVFFTVVVAAWVASGRGLWERGTMDVVAVSERFHFSWWWSVAGLVAMS